jgi:hypothetical protein
MNTHGTVTRLIDRTLIRPWVAVRRWPVESQLGARRNAMVASTVLARRRAELQDVEEFLAARRGAPMSEVVASAANG